MTKKMSEMAKSAGMVAKIYVLIDEATRKHGASDEQIHSLSTPGGAGLVDQIGRLIAGRVEIKPVAHLIDCDAAPFIPEGWSVKKEDQLKSAVGGQFTWDPAKVRLVLSKKQEGGKYIEGNELRRELKNQPVLNANVLDFLREHPELIPDEWKGKYTFFWGTLYRDRGGNPCVRYLCWRGGRWYSDCAWLVSSWHDCNPAACAQAST